MAIDEKKLKEEIESLTMHITGLRAGRGVLNEFMKQYRESILRIIDEQPKTDWIPCEVEMPKEHDSIFAKFKGTNKWSSGMFEKLSDEVNVTVEFSDGTRKVITTHTADGKWHAEKFSHLKTKVIAWMPMIQPYKKEGNSHENT